jgi:hypothetical protein
MQKGLPFTHSNHCSGSAVVFSGSVGRIGVAGGRGIPVFSMAATAAAPPANADSSAMDDMRPQMRPLSDLRFICAVCSALPRLRCLLLPICALWDGKFRDGSFV